MYPNPATDFCNFEFIDGEAVVSVTLMDITGREFSSMPANQPSYTYAFNTAFLAPGVYIAKLKSYTGKNAIVKMIKD